jgi:hypothetical protein
MYFNGFGFSAIQAPQHVLVDHVSWQMLIRRSQHYVYEPFEGGLNGCPGFIIGKTVAFRQREWYRYPKFGVL